MNKIEVKESELPDIIDPVLCVYIDGRRLDQLVAEATSEQVFLGYIPSWHDDLFSLEDGRLIWQRSASRGSRILLPLLLCPEERDLSFRPVVTEFSVEGEIVRWKKIGELTQYVGRDKVNWLADVTYTFRVQDFMAMLKVFYDKIEKGSDAKLKELVAEQMCKINPHANQ